MKLIFLLIAAISINAYPVSVSGGGSVSQSQWKTSVTTVTALPMSSNITGDCRASQDTGLVYCWTGTSWYNNGVRIASTLLNGLQAYYNFNQTSSPSTDLSGNGNDMVWSNVPTSVSGLLGNAVHLGASGTVSLKSAASGSLNVGASGSFTNSQWIKLDGTTNDETTMLRFTNGCAGLLSWLDIAPSTTYLTFQVNSNGGRRSLQNSTTPSTAAWHLVVVWVDSAAHTQNIRLDNGTVTSQSFTDTLSELGNDCAGVDGFSGGNYAVDEAGYWNRVLTSGEQAALYNTGSGTTYPALGFNNVIPFLPKTVASTKLPQSPFVLAGFAR